MASGGSVWTSWGKCLTTGSYRIPQQVPIMAHRTAAAVLNAPDRDLDEPVCRWLPVVSQLDADEEVDGAKVEAPGRPRQAPRGERDERSTKRADPLGLKKYMMSKKPARSNATAGSSSRCGGPGIRIVGFELERVGSLPGFSALRAGGVGAPLRMPIRLTRGRVSSAGLCARWVFARSPPTALRLFGRSLVEGERVGADHEQPCPRVSLAGDGDPRRLACYVCIDSILKHSENMPAIVTGIMWTLVILCGLLALSPIIFLLRKGSAAPPQQLPRPLRPPTEPAKKPSKAASDDDEFGGGDEGAMARQRTALR